MVAGELVTIRTANANDFDIWFELLEAVAAEGKWIGTEAPVDRDSRRRNFDIYLNSEDAVTFLAEVEGQVIGNLGIEIRQGIGHMGMLIDERWRGRGVGSTLVERCVDWARVHGAHKVSLEVWPHNARAIALYKKFGFEHEGLQRRHYRRRSGQLWDSITMGLVLDSTSPGNPFVPGS